MTTKTQHKAALVAALYELDQAGALTGLSQSEIARRLGVTRFRVCRMMPAIRALSNLVPDLLQTWQAATDDYYEVEKSRYDAPSKPRRPAIQNRCNPHS